MSLQNHVATSFQGQAAVRAKFLLDSTGLEAPRCQSPVLVHPAHPRPAGLALEDALKEAADADTCHFYTGETGGHVVKGSVRRERRVSNTWRIFSRPWMLAGTRSQIWRTRTQQNGDQGHLHWRSVLASALVHYLNESSAVFVTRCDFFC